MICEERNVETNLRFISLDAASAELIGQIIREWFHGWTVIAITHNVDSLLDYDSVVVLDNGRLVGYGPAPGR
jgi:ABC-type multidrug transport system fused ATPase/permease subunit